MLNVASETARLKKGGKGKPLARAEARTGFEGVKISIFLQKKYVRKKKGA
jgi:hypothetical protein